MTFATETVRMLYHQIPASQQDSLVNLDERCARDGNEVCIDAVSRFDNISEVILRITLRDKFSAVTGDNIPST